MQILLAGDTHGEFRAIAEKLNIAAARGITYVFVLGDFGLWWGYEGVKFIDDINEMARRLNVTIVALPGNHENYDWWNAVIATAPSNHRMAYLRTNVMLSPRVNTWRWAGKQFVVAGGAVSIDRAWRQQAERDTGKRLWSPGEQLTDAEVDEIESWNVKADYLLTHDCSNATPWGHRLKPDLTSQIHRQKIDRVLSLVTPGKHFHGHMHERYEWTNVYGNRSGEGVETQTYGLECNTDDDSWGILDTATDEFLFATDIEANERGEDGEAIRNANTSLRNRQAEIVGAEQPMDLAEANAFLGHAGD